jgi:hypothetical protein
LSVATPSTVSTLSDYADELLGVAIDALNTTAAGAPDRSYVSPAQPTFDCCPMLSVVVNSLTEEATSPAAPAGATARRTTFGSIILAGYQVWAIRCAPSIDGNQLPSPSEIAASALEVQEDGWALWNGLRHAVARGDIFDSCVGVHFDGGVPINEQGGCVGWLFRIRAMIPGIPLA